MASPSSPSPPGPRKRIRLRQAQVWQHGGQYLRIVRLERLQVEFKATATLAGKEGTHHTLSKKEFCRLLKEATLVAPEGMQRFPPV